MKKTGIELIAEERREQIEKHGRTIAIDQSNNSEGEMIIAARALLIEDNDEYEPDDTVQERVSEMPGDWETPLCQKMASESRRDRLIRAGAFIAAELDAFYPES